MPEALETVPATLTRAQAAAEILKRRAARRVYKHFMAYTWEKPWPFRLGRHTDAMCTAIDGGLDALREGKSTFLNIAVPFAHGKSDVGSRYLTPYTLGRLQDMHPDILMSGYGGSLIQGFSRDARRIIRSPAYKALFPNVAIATGENRAANWAIRGSTGRVHASGLGGALAGMRANLLVLDDYCKNRREARSETYRNKTWDSFTNDLMTRRASKCFVIVMATPWHVDDVRGRIRDMMAKDPAFPRFQELRFPARVRNAAGGVDYLFPEQYPVEWYETQYATLHKWATSLLDCDPVAEGGNRFNPDLFDYHKTDAGFPPSGAVEVRAWDLASSEKEREKDEPDFTVGVRGCVTHERLVVRGHDGTLETVDIPHVWVRNIVMIRAEAPERDNLIRTTALHDGPAVKVYVEAFAGYKDAYTTLKKVLRGRAIVHKSNLPGDKGAKLADLETVVDAGNLHIVPGEHKSEIDRQFRAFPDGKHDDICDAVAILYHECTRSASGIAIF